MTNGAVIVFARRPELGGVKSRLERVIGNEVTLSLYRAFLQDTLIASRRTGRTVMLAHTPGAHFPEQDLADISYTQRGASFGERFDGALMDAARHTNGDNPLILIGADTPHLSPSFLQASFAALEKYHAVIGPNVNGGFYLLGFSRPPVAVREVFTHPPEEETKELLSLLHDAGYNSKLLEPQFDVDLPEDLVKLIQFIDSLDYNTDWVPQNTRRALGLQSQTLDRALTISP